MKYTPGPWEVYKEGYYWPNLHIVKKLNENEHKNVTVIPNGQRSISEEVKANAQLIATAPELLEELKKHCYNCWSKLDNEDACQGCKTGKLIKHIDEMPHS